MNDLSGCSVESGGPNLVYGNLTETVPACGNPSGTPGITFSRQGTKPGNGNFLFVQTVDSDTSSNGYNSNGKSIVCTAVSGVDGAYPYQNAYDPVSRADAPTMPLPFSPNASRTFNATMYLMWQSTDTPNSIPVPLGYVPWTFSGTATCNSSCGSASNWTPSGVGGPTNQFYQTTSSDPNLGFPTWPGPAATTCTYQ